MCCFSRKCLNIVDKILQIIVILLLVLYIVSFFINLGIKNLIWLILLIAFYIIYIIFELCSPECKFLCNKAYNNDIKEILGRIFKQGPVFKLHCECFHYEIQTVRFSPPKKGKKGKAGKKGVGGGTKKAQKKIGGRGGGIISQLWGIGGGGAAIGVGTKGTRNGIVGTMQVERKVVTHRETVIFLIIVQEI